MRREEGSGFHSWIYDYDRPTREKRWVGCGFEIGIQLDGSWRLERHRIPTTVIGHGMIAAVAEAERYRLTFAPNRGRGLQVGYVIFGERLRALEQEAGGPLALVEPVGDPELFDYADHVATSWRKGRSVDALESEKVVTSFLRRRADAAGRRPLDRSRRELEDFDACDLPIAHIAAAGGLHAETFTRQFARNFGLTPASYRKMRRLNHANRLLWSEPALPLAAVALRCGFASPAYFWREFLAAFRVTPAQQRRVFLEALR